jgi:K319L-like, PKD domain
MISTTRAALSGVLVAFTVAAVLIAGCSSVSSSSPVAHAGANQTVKASSVVTLDGSGSSAPGGGALTYDWSFSSVPNGSAARLVNNTSDRPSFTPDKVGAYAVSLVVKDSAGKASTSDVTHVTVVPAEGSDTKIIVTSASTKKDLYLGDQVTTTGRLVDAEGNGIPNQTILLKSVAHVPIFGDRITEIPVTTDSTGAFTKVTTVSAPAQSLIQTVNAEAWIEYAGNDFYKPTSTSHSSVTIHLTSPPGS